MTKSVKTKSTAKAKTKTSAKATVSAKAKTSTSKYSKVQPVQKLAVINSRFRHGDLSKLAKKTGFSTSTVSAVIEGRNENERILNVAYDMTRSRKKNFQVIKDLTSKKPMVNIEG